MGLTVDEARRPPFDVWPDNLAAVQFFDCVPPGAWNIGPGGPSGIRPEAYREVRLAMGVSASAWRDIYPDICVMEAAALDHMHRDRK